MRLVAIDDQNIGTGPRQLQRATETDGPGADDQDIDIRDHGFRRFGRTGRALRESRSRQIPACGRATDRIATGRTGTCTRKMSPHRR